MITLQIEDFDTCFAVSDNRISSCRMQLQLNIASDKGAARHHKGPRVRIFAMADRNRPIMQCLWTSLSWHLHFTSWLDGAV